MDHAARESRGRGQALLLAHCLALGALDVQPRTPALERLQRTVRPDLLRLLLVALTGDHTARSNELVA